VKNINNLKGLHVVKNLSSAKKSSIPKKSNSAFLELYLLKKEQERLIKEGEGLCMRKDSVKKRLKEIESEMIKLYETADKAGEDVSPSEVAFVQKDDVKKEWKNMSLNY